MIDDLFGDRRMDRNTPPPLEAVKLGHYFFPHDYKWGIRDFEQWARYAIEAARLTSDEKEKIKDYLNDLLVSDDNVLVSNAWHALGTAVFFATPDLGGERPLLFTIRDLL